MKPAKGARTRTQIIEAALELFLAKGVHTVSLQEIGRAAGLAQSSFYNHFPSKEALLLECCRYVTERGRELIDARLDPRAPADVRLRTYLEGNLIWMRTERAQSNALLALYYFGGSDPAIRELHAEVDRVGMGRIETHLVQGNREHVWSVADPAGIARLIHDLIIGEMIKTFQRPSELKLEQRLEQVWSGALRLVRDPSRPA